MGNIENQYLNQVFSDIKNVIESNFDNIDDNTREQLEKVMNIDFETFKEIQASKIARGIINNIVIPSFKEYIQRIIRNKIKIIHRSFSVIVGDNIININSDENLIAAFFDGLYVDLVKVNNNQYLYTSTMIGTLKLVLLKIENEDFPNNFS